MNPKEIKAGDIVQLTDGSVTYVDKDSPIIGNKGFNEYPKHILRKGGTIPYKGTYYIIHNTYSNVHLFSPYPVVELFGSILIKADDIFKEMDILMSKVDKTLEAKPQEVECRCDIKALMSYGHERVCNYIQRKGDSK